MKSFRKTTAVVAILAACIMLLAAIEDASARVNTGTRPISPSTGKPFGTNTGTTGKGVGGESNTNVGGSAGTTPPPSPRRHHGPPRG